MSMFGCSSPQSWSRLVHLTSPSLLTKAVYFTRGFEVKAPGGRADGTGATVTSRWPTTHAKGAVLYGRGRLADDVAALGAEDGMIWSTTQAVLGRGDMVRLSDLHEAEAEHMRARAAAMSPVEPAPWITPRPLVESTVALVSTAGLHRRSDPPFQAGAVDYRIIPGDVDFADCVLSHISTNFDRSAFQQDPNISFPLDRLREMEAAGEIGGVSQWHYSFMGAQPNHGALAATGEEVGRLLAADGVDVALLVPI